MSRSLQVHGRRVARDAHGFSLVEMLAAVAIIAVLASLTAIGLNKVRLQADQAVTVHNLSALQRANLVYAGDHDGGFVPVRAFDEKGNSYVAWCNNPEFVAAVKGCSLEQAMVSSNIAPNALDPRARRAVPQLTSFAGSYGYNCEGIPNTGGWASPSSTSYFRSGQLAAPSRTMAFITATDWQAKYSGRFLWKDAAATEGRTPDGKIAYRYNGKALAAFYDGHVDSITMADMKRIDSMGQGIRNIFWDGDANPDTGQ
jgi:prepilin-type N-terminal cleavage/methylation domain-containing protein